MNTQLPKARTVILPIHFLAFTLAAIWIREPEHGLGVLLGVGIFFLWLFLKQIPTPPGGKVPDLLLFFGVSFGAFGIIMILNHQIFGSMSELHLTSRYPQFAMRLFLTFIAMMGALVTYRMSLWIACGQWKKTLGIALASMSLAIACIFIPGVW